MSETLRKAAEQAFYRLENHPGNYKLTKAESEQWQKDTLALRAALAEYTAPPAQTPPPRLTDEQIKSIAATLCAIPGTYVHALARAIESAVRKQVGVQE